MALYSFQAQTFSRGKGQSAVAAAAYRSGERLIDEQTNEVKHYPVRAERVAFSAIMMPVDAPARFRSRQFLWNEVERYERRVDARLAREFMVALPHELTDQQREWLVREFVRETLTRRGYGADINIHKPDRGDDRNFHCHIMFTDRQIGPGGFRETKDLSLNSKAQLQQWRKRWADLTNHYLERFGHAARVDHRSLIAQGIDREPTIHLGPAASEMIARGADTDRGSIQASIRARNALGAQIATDAAALARLQQRAANENRLQIAVDVQDVGAVIDLLTRRRPTFGSRDLARFLARSIAAPEARAEFSAAVLAHPSIVSLAATANGRVTRYTTRSILAAEAQVLRTADKMAGSRRHRLPWLAVKEVLARPAFRGIDPEQVDALQHLTQTNALSILIGRAGTGKSYTLNALRQAYENDGFNVVGLAFTNKVAQSLSRDGFRQAATIHSEMRAIEHARRSWDARTVVVVDEAAMLSTELMGRLVAQANATGAKLILAGDDRQLPSIDRGGLFALMCERYGAARLTTVRRQHDPEECRASELLGAGRVAEALAIYEGRQALHWSATQDEARGALVAHWLVDRAAHPEASRYVVASTNAEVDHLNAALRQGVRETDAAAGYLNPETWLKTSRGLEPYAAGDRLTLLGHDRQRGLSNGQFGTVLEVTPERMMVRLDDRPGEPVSFDPREYPHFRHGFAGTIHKVQGDTIDRLFVSHSPHLRDASAYVALTRHREALAVFLARETVADLDQLAQQLSRPEAQQAASSFHRVAPDAPTRPDAATGRRSGESRLQVPANNQRPIITPTAAQGEGRETVPPVLAQRAAGRAAGPAAGTTQTVKERWRVRADGTYERLSGPPAALPEQGASRLPAPPPRLLEAEKASVPPIPVGRAEQIAAERRALGRGDVERVKQMHRTTGELAREYIRLAQRPTANLSAWLAQDGPVPPVATGQPAPIEAAPVQADERASARRADQRSAVAGWSEKADRVSQETSANQAVKRAQGYARPKAGPRSTSDYVNECLALARNPLANLPAWLAQDANPAFLPQPKKDPRHAAPDPNAADRTAGAGVSLRGGEVPPVRGRVDADRGGRLDGDRLPLGPAPGASRPEVVQPVRGAGDGPPGELTPPAALTAPASPFRPLPPSPSLSVTLSYGTPTLTSLAAPVPDPGTVDDRARLSPERAEPARSVTAAPAAPEEAAVVVSRSQPSAPSEAVPFVSVHPTLPRPAAPVAAAAASPIEPAAQSVRQPTSAEQAAAPPAGAFRTIPAIDKRANQVRRPVDEPATPPRVQDPAQADRDTSRAAAERALAARLFGGPSATGAPRFVAPPLVSVAPSVQPSSLESDLAAAAREHTEPQPPKLPMPVAAPSPSASAAAAGETSPDRAPAAAVPATPIVPAAVATPAAALAPEPPAQGAFSFPTQPAPPAAPSALDPATAALLAALAQQTAALKEVMERPASTAVPAQVAASTTPTPAPPMPLPAPQQEAAAQEAAQATPAAAAQPAPRGRALPIEQLREMYKDFVEIGPNGVDRPLSDKDLVSFDLARQRGRATITSPDGTQRLDTERMFATAPQPPFRNEDHPARTEPAPLSRPPDQAFGPTPGQPPGRSRR